MRTDHARRDRLSSLTAAALGSLVLGSCAGPAATAFVSVTAPRVAITHVRVIDGTGAPARDDQTVVIEDGRIRDVGGVAAIRIPADARTVDGRGRTLIPGLVGMH